MDGSRSASRTIFTRAQCPEPFRIRSQVRAAGTHSGTDAGSVRTGGSRYRFATPYARTFFANLGGLSCYQKLWFPGGGFHCGFHGIAASGDHHAAVNDHMKTTMLAAQRQPIQPQVFSGSTVWETTHCVGINTP